MGFHRHAVAQSARRPQQVRRPLAHHRVSGRRLPHLRHVHRARLARQPHAEPPAHLQRHPLPARFRADRLALDRRQPARARPQRQARPDLLTSSPLFCHSERSKECTWIGLAESHWILRYAQNDTSIASVPPFHSHFLPAHGHHLHARPAVSAAGRMAAVNEMTRLIRLLFEVEREFVRTAPTLIYRVGEPELKYLLCQHVWESAGHARFLRERGRELTGFGTTDTVRETVRRVFTEAVGRNTTDPLVLAAGFYGVLKPALLAAYRHYLKVTDPLADWPSKKLVEEFVADEERHLREFAPYLKGVEAREWKLHLTQALDDLGGWLGQETRLPLAASYMWQHVLTPYTHPP